MYNVLGYTYDIKWLADLIVLVKLIFIKLLCSSVLVYSKARRLDQISSTMISASLSGFRFARYYNSKTIVPGSIRNINTNSFSRCNCNSSRIRWVDSISRVLFQKSGIALAVASLSTTATGAKLKIGIQGAPLDRGQVRVNILY